MRLMIFSRKNWVGISRLPFALKQAGFEVGVVCPDGYYLSATAYADYKLPYASDMGRVELYGVLQRAFQDWSPDLVIPGDDTSVWFLRNACIKAAETLSPPHLNVISQSLCKLEQREAVEMKTVLGAITDTLGIDFPAQLISPGLEEAIAFTQTHGFPVALKRDYTYAGLGVVICRDLRELRENHATVAEKSRQEKDDFALQQFIAGAPSSVSFSALNGKMLAAFAFRAEVTRNATGFTSIARIIENQTMITATEKLVSYFGYSGFGGLDFILDETDRPWLLEINPRPTPTSHLGTLVGADLCGALYVAMSGKAVPALAAKRVERIAMFPYAWVQETQTIGEFSGYHDVPWYDPPLLAMMVRDFYGKCKVSR